MVLCVYVLRAMTQKKGVGGRERRNLTIIGGHAGCKAADASEWKFSEISEPIVTHLDTSVDSIIASNVDDDGSDTGNVTNDSDGEIDYTTKDDNSEMDYTTEDEDSDKDVAPSSYIPACHSGDHILDFPALQSSIKSTGYCKQCAMDEWESFLSYCEERSTAVIDEANKRRNSIYIFINTVT